MTALWTRDEAIAATGGTGQGEWRASGISIDSRSISAGDLFVALAGPHFDGHDFVAAAVAAGAAAAMVHRLPADMPERQALLMVADTLEGLRALGREARRRTAARIAGVTGSVGKTGSKEMLRTALAPQGATHASLGSLNNHWGLPLSLARMARDTRFGIFEMGMNHSGEIAPLSRLARPHVAIITTIAPVHTEFFGSLDAIADAKAEIFLGMDDGGLAILNRDIDQYGRLADAARACGLRTASFGSHPDADARLVDIALEPAGSGITAALRGRPMTYRLNVPGRHWAVNSLAVLLAAEEMGADVPAAAAALAAMRPPKGRGERHQVAVSGGNLELIDESYNASPASMQAAFAVLGAARPADGGRRIAVLGDMLELGPRSVDLHMSLLEGLVAAGVDLVFAAGPAMAELHGALPAAMRGGHAPTSAELAPLVRAGVRAGDVVMVKGSAGSRMGVVVRDLLQSSGADRAAAS